MPAPDLANRLRRIKKRLWHRSSSTPEICEAHSGQVLGDPLPVSDFGPSFQPLLAISNRSAPPDTPLVKDTT